VRRFSPRIGETSAAKAGKSNLGGPVGVGFSARIVGILGHGRLSQGMLGPGLVELSHGLLSHGLLSHGLLSHGLVELSHGLLSHGVLGHRILGGGLMDAVGRQRSLGFSRSHVAGQQIAVGKISPTKRF
jgi:hypothetical protein